MQNKCLFKKSLIDHFPKDKNYIRFGK
ncbi:MAG: hypothetical protein EXR17_06040 [Flavobacteriaceae bacterium]|nr:hypothetical protein [Flavobacteriaceae bacterium]